MTRARWPTAPLLPLGKIVMALRASWKASRRVKVGRLVTLGACPMCIVVRKHKPRRLEN